MEVRMLQKPWGHAHVKIKGKSGLYCMYFYLVSQKSVTMVLKCKYQRLTRGVCDIIYVLRQAIQTLSLIFKSMCINIDIKVLTKNNI